MALTLAQIQAMITNKEDSRQIINEITDYLEANPGGGGGVESVTAGDASIEVGGTATEPTIKLPYLVYKALLTQEGTDAPVATVLQNTLGGTVVWARSNTGDYTGTLTGAFTLNKTFLPQPGNTAGVSSQVFVYRVSDNVVNVISGTQDGTLADDTLFNTSIYIEVHP